MTAVTAQGRIEKVERRLAAEPLWRWDTQSVVASVLLAVAFSATMQVTERIDFAMTGGLAVPLGFTFLAVWFPVTVNFFGLTGALLIANFNPLIAILTATHPLAWSFPFLNMATGFMMAVLFRWHLRRGKSLRLLDFVLYIGISQACAVVIMAVGLYGLVLQLGASQIAFFAFVQWIPGTFVAAPMGYALYRAVARSRVLE